MCREKSAFSLHLVILLANLLENILQSMNFETFVRKWLEAASNVWRSSSLLENSISRDIVGLYPPRSVQNLKAGGSPDSLGIIVVWTYHTVGVQNTPECYCSLCSYCCWIFWIFSVPNSIGLNVRKVLQCENRLFIKLIRRKKRESDDILSILIKKGQLVEPILMVVTDVLFCLIWKQLN